MDWENFNAQKNIKLIKILAPVLAFLLIAMFVVVPVMMAEISIRKEAEAKGTEVHKLIDFNLF